MKKRIIECVPNFSEGVDLHVVDQICDEIKSVARVKLLHVDIGKDTNRTVVTFAGEPEAVCEAAFLAVKKAQELIDMRLHKGAHPRMGATDVLPLVPIANITLEETAQLADQLAQRIAEELSVPIYLYEASAKVPERKHLANCRSGEYENLHQKIGQADSRPDYGPTEYTEQVARSGATVVGARNFLIAVNYNLNTTSTQIASAIALDVREKGRPMREDNEPTSKVCLDAEGNTLMVPGTLKGVRAIGWYIEEYGMAQVSMNITDIDQTPLHLAYEEVRLKAEVRGVRVTGTEIIGLVPKRVMLEAGHYYLERQHRSAGVSECEIIRMAERSMGLNELHSWDMDERIIEYLLEKDDSPLLDLTLSDFLQVTASESVVPSGASVSAYVGALGVSMGVMVANLSAKKQGWDERWHVFSEYAEKGQEIMAELSHLVEENTRVLEDLARCCKMPNKADADRRVYHQALEKANTRAATMSLRTMYYCIEAIPLLQSMLDLGTPSSPADVKVGMVALYAAVEGAYQHVCVNVDGLRDLDVADELLGEAKKLRKTMRNFIHEHYR